MFGFTKKMQFSKVINAIMNALENGTSFKNVQEPLLFLLK